MRTIDEVYLVGNAPAPKTGGYVEIAGKPITRKSTPTDARVPKEELELTYLHNPTIFNGINKITQTIMGAPHKIVAKDPKVQAYFRSFTERLGTSGSDITWEELLSQIFKYQCIYGWAFVENVYNRTGNKIVDWDLIDPKKMDYAKDARLYIAMDKFGKPLGYVETLPTGVMIAENNLPVELQGKVFMPTNSIFLERKRIALVKLYSVGDGFYPIGLIEPIYRTSLRKMNIEEAVANAIWRHGFPIILANVGDTNHEPTPQQVKSILSKLKDVSYKQELAVPFYYDLKILESKKAEKLREHLDYFREQEVSGLGIPKPFATGGGEETNRATLGNQTDMFMLTLKDIIARTTDQIRQYMFKPICDLEGFKEVPTITFDAVGVDEIAKKAKRLLEYLDKGVVTTEEIKGMIKDFEKIDES